MFQKMPKIQQKKALRQSQDLLVQDIVVFISEAHHICILIEIKDFKKIL